MSGTTLARPAPCSGPETTICILTLPYSFYFYGDAADCGLGLHQRLALLRVKPGHERARQYDCAQRRRTRQAVFAFWDDLNVVASGQAGSLHRNFGSSPNCSTVVMWKDSRRKGANGGGLNPLNQVSFGNRALRGRQNRGALSRLLGGRCPLQLLKVKDATAGTYENQTGTVGPQYLANGT